MFVTVSYPFCGYLLHSVVPGISKCSVNGSTMTTRLTTGSDFYLNPNFIKK